MKNSFAIIGLLLDITGAILLVIGIFRRQATAARHILRQEEIQEYKWLSRIPLRLTIRFFESRNALDMNQETLFEAIPTMFWALCCLCLGFALQIVNYLF